MSSYNVYNPVLIKLCSLYSSKLYVESIQFEDHQVQQNSGIIAETELCFRIVVRHTTPISPAIFAEFIYPR